MKERPSNRLARARLRAALLATCAAAAFSAGCAASGPSAGEQRAADELAAARRASRSGEWPSAAAQWHEIRRRADEHSLEACIEETRALLELGDASSAQHLAELGLKTFPRDADLHALRARALVEGGLPAAAQTAYEQALKADPERLDLLRALANLRCDLGRNEDALALLAPQLASGRANAEDFAIAARARRALGRFSEAFADCERSFALQFPPPERLVDAASMVFEPPVRGQDAHAAAVAQSWLEQAVALDPQLTLGHLLLGRLAADGQRDGDAAAHLRRAVETDPASVAALTELSRVQARRGELGDSKAMAERALALEKDPEKRKELELLAHPPETAAPDEKPADPPPRDQ